MDRHRQVVAKFERMGADDHRPSFDHRLRDLALQQSDHRIARHARRPDGEVDSEIASGGTEAAGKHRGRGRHLLAADDLPVGIAAHAAVGVGRDVDGGEPSMLAESRQEKIVAHGAVCGAQSLRLPERRQDDGAAEFFQGLCQERVRPGVGGGAEVDVEEYLSGPEVVEAPGDVGVGLPGPRPHADCAEAAVVDPDEDDLSAGVPRCECHARLGHHVVGPAQRAEPVKAEDGGRDEQEGDDARQAARGLGHRGHAAGSAAGERRDPASLGRIIPSCRPCRCCRRPCRRPCPPSRPREICRAAVGAGLAEIIVVARSLASVVARA